MLLHGVFLEKLNFSAFSKNFQKGPLDEVKKLKRAKENKTAVTNVVTATGGDSQAIVNNLLSTLKTLEKNLASSVEQVIDDKLEGIDDMIIEFVRCKTENESLKNKINDLNKENFNLKWL